MTRASGRFESFPLRARVAVRTAWVLNAVSRRLGRGEGTVVGGSVALMIDGNLLRELTADREVALVSGTNGKTTTTKLLVAALQRGSSVPVVTNSTGSNMPAGHLGALIDADSGAPAVLEVDEGYLKEVLDASRAKVVVLLNLSRDQLDRTNEVRMMAERWRQALRSAARRDGSGETSVVVANADDPLVVYAAEGSANVVWVAGGQRWRADSTGCPKCGGRVVYNETPEVTGDSFDPPWACVCGFVSPEPEAWIVEDTTSRGASVVFKGGQELKMELLLPGRFNYSNAMMALLGARVFGVSPSSAASAMAEIGEVAGRYSTRVIGGVSTRCLLAKNPAGWTELLEVVSGAGGPIVIGINAKVADGQDPSWLWDVEFESLKGRTVVATGERCWDLAVRLRYAGVDHQVCPDPVEALRAGRELELRRDACVEFIGNYTVFHDVVADSGGSNC